MEVREEALNVLLAELLCEKGLKALGEPILKKPKTLLPDVLLDIRGVKILLEGKRPGKRHELRKKAEDRLDQRVCDMCVMVEYAQLNIPGLQPTTKDLKQALLNGKYNVGFITYVERVGLERWIEGFKPKLKTEFYEGINFQELLSYLMSAYDYVVKEDILDPVVRKIGTELERLAQDLLTEGIDVRRLKDILELYEKQE